MKHQTKSKAKNHMKKRAKPAKRSARGKKKSFLSSLRTSKKSQLLVFLIVFAIAGGVTLWRINAASTSLDTQVENDQYIRIIQHRQSKNVAAPNNSPCLRDVAREWAKYMAANQVFKHNPNLGSKATSYCGNWQIVGENIGHGSTKSSSIFDAFLNSSGHKANIEKSAYTHVAVGAYRDSGNKLWISQVFAQCNSSCTSSKWSSRAKLTIKTSGLPSGSVASFTTIDRTGTGRHGVGYCEHSFGVNGSKVCYSSYGGGIGWHDHGSGDRSGTLILAPPSVSGYTFVGWETKQLDPVVSTSADSKAARMSYWNDFGTKSHCNSRTVSISCLNIPGGFSGEITALYSRSTASLTIKTSGLPSGKSVTFKTPVHSAGGCGTSFSVSGSKTCKSSAATGIGWHDHGSGYRGGIILDAPSVSGYKFTGWSGHDGKSSDQNQHCGSLASDQRCINIAPGSSDTVTAKYVKI